MTIENLGVKLYSGTKQDRKSDSLGSSADGSNSGITLTPIKTNRTTNKIDFTALRDGVNHALSYDLGATLSDTLWVCRFVINFSKLGSSGNGNYLYVGLSDKDSSTGQDGNQDFIGTQIQIDGTSYYHSNDSDGGAIPGTGSGDNNQSWTPAIDTNYYVEMIRSADDTYSITIRTGSHSGTSLGTVAGTCATTTVGLRYFKVLNVINSSGGRDLEGTIDTITIDNGASTYSSADYTVNPNSTTGWSGNYKLGTGCYEFDGSNDYVECGTTSDWKFLHDGSKSTIAFWAKLDDTSQGDPAGIICTSNINNSSTGTAVFISNGDEICYLTNNGSTSTQNSQNIHTIPDTDWHHYAFTYDGSLANTNLVFYVDGVQKATGNKQNTFATGNSTNPLRIGRGNSVYFGGELDDIGIYKRVLTATEISALVNAPNSWWIGGTSKNVTIDGNNVTTLSGSAWANWVQGKAVTSPTTLEFSVDDTTTNCIVGFGTGTGADSPSAGSPMKHCVYLTSGGDIFWSDSTGETDTGSNRAAGDTYKLVWQSNGNLDLYLKPSGGSYGSSLKSWTSVTGTLYPMVQGYGGIVVTMLPTETADGALVSSLSNKSNLKAYYSMDSTSLGATATVDIDFTEYSDQTAADNAWASSDTAKVRANPSTDVLDFTNTRDNTNDTIVHDIGTANISDTWVLRFKINGSTWTTGGQSVFNVGLSGSDESVNDNDGQHWIGIEFRNNSGENRLGVTHQAGSSGHISSANNSNVSYTWAANTDYFVELKRVSSSSIVATVWTGSFGGTQVATKENTTSNSSVANLRYFKVANVTTTGVGNSEFIGTIDNIQLYDGVSAVDGCKNDFSTTSALDGVTGIRTNSIFQQTDDTPSYWWFNGTSWVLDGTTLAIDEDFSTNNFTSNDTNVTNVVDGALTYWGAGQNQYGKGAYYKTPVTLNDNKWVMRARYEIEAWSSPSADSYQVFIGMIKFTTAANAQGVSSSYNQDGISFGHRIGSGTNGIRIGASDVGGQLYNNFETLTSLTGTRTCWIELTRLSSTTSKLEVFSDEGFTTSIGVTPTLTHGAVTGLDTIMINSSQGNGTGGSNHGNIDNLQIQNGTSEWLE